MAISFRAPTGHVGGSGRHKTTLWCVLCLALAAFSSDLQAQPTETWTLKSGLNTWAPNHLARLTVVDTSGAPETSIVTIEWRNEAGRVIGRKEGVLTGSTPVRHDLRVGGSAAFEQRRVIVSIKMATGGLTAPVVTLEDLAPDLGFVWTRGVCGPPIGRIDPQPFCPHWLIFTTQP
jgi:hypothetical protein